MLNPSNDELATLMLCLLNIALPNEDKADVIQSNTHINTPTLHVRKYLQKQG